MPVLYALYSNDGPVRYNQLKRKLGTISFKTLTNTLKELEADHLSHESFLRFQIVMVVSTLANITPD